MQTQRWTLGLFLLAIASCHSDRADPASAEATQGGDDPIYDGPSGTIGPNVGTGPAPTVSGDGLGPGSGGPADIVGGAGGVGGDAGIGGIGGGGGGIGGSGGGGGIIEQGK